MAREGIMDDSGWNGCDDWRCEECEGCSNYVEEENEYCECYKRCKRYPNCEFEGRTE